MIVVLPFENMGPPEDAYFAAGVSQEITSTLASVGGLGLISRTSAGRYAGTQKTIREIGAELGVDYVVEGSVRWQKRADGPDRVRITPQLIRVSDDTQVWTEQYDREMEDIFEIQSAIAGEVASQLGIALAASGMAGTSEPLTKNMEAYRLYLKAQKLWKTTEGDDAISLVLATLERAVELDPEFVAAWSILSRFHSSLYHGYTDRTEDRLVLAREAADRIFEISPDHPQGHIAFGYYYYWGRKDYERALEAFSKTGNLQESDPDVIEAVGFIRRRQGRWEEGLERIETAARLDPQSTTLAYEVAWTLEFLRRYDEALDSYDRAISLNPELSWIYVEKALLHLLRTGDAVASESIVREAPDPVDPQWNVYLSYHRLHAGRYEEALELVAADTIRAYDSPSYMYPKPLWMALVSSCTDNNERTQELAEESLSYLQGRIRNESQDPRLRLALGQTYALLGRKAEALREGRMAIDIFPMSRDAIRGHVYQVRQSEIYALAGEEEAALDLLEQLLAIPGILSPNLIKTNPLYRSLHGNPRYEALIAGAS